MPTNVCTPFFKPGQDITGYCTAAIAGKTFVNAVAGGRGGFPHIAPAAAGGVAIGVAGHDQVLGGTVHYNVGGNVPVLCAADITAGTRVQSDATGKAVPWTTGVSLGVATSNGTNGGSVSVQLNLG